MKLHCKCGGTRFEVDVQREEIILRCIKCKGDFLKEFAPRILERIVKNLSGKLFGYN